MNLFEHRERLLTEAEAPLAARMRPRNLDEFVGQGHIMAPGRLLRRAIEADRLTSLIFYGPPGTGKTTLAEVIARHTRAHFEKLNAVLAGVKDLREAIATARRRRGQDGIPTVLFIDEVHRFNKAQQDALLPWVERGTVTLIGATTENPYFEVNKALVSRSRIFQLQALDEEDLHNILDAALADEERGYGKLPVIVTSPARDHLVNVANGDARSLLGALELAVETTSPNKDGDLVITLSVAEESIQQRAVLYDKEGDAHFDIISAFIKSLRGSDPDAALYWMARMVYAGEDPRFIFRRMLIFASEDVGLADPQVLTGVVAAATAFDRVGMPEGRFHLAQACLLLANAAKSNSTLGFFDALAVVGSEREGEVPTHLKDGSRDKEGFGHGKGYLYPHAYRDHWVEQQYLPTDLVGRVFYTPSRQGREATIYDQVHRRREAQIAAMVERDALGTGPAEILTTGDDADFERWVQRTLSDVGGQLGQLRDTLMEAARLVRHHIVLDLNAGVGLLTFEAARRTPEGGVYARCADSRAARALDQRAAGLPELRRPITFTAELDALDDALPPDLRVDAIIGRNALVTAHDKERVVARLAARLDPNGRVVLLEGLPAHTQRLYELLPADVDLGGGKLRERWAIAEEAIYGDPEDPLLDHDIPTLQRVFAEVGLEAEIRLIELSTERLITSAQLDRWFARPQEAGRGRPSYRSRIANSLNAAEVDLVEAAMRRQLANKTIAWKGAAALLVATTG